MTSKHDATENSIDFTLGTSFDKGNIVFGVQYTDRGEASQGDRGFSDCPILETKQGVPFVVDLHLVKVATFIM